MSFSFTGVNIPSYLVRAQKMDLLDYLILKADSELLNFIIQIFLICNHISSCYFIDCQFINQEKSVTCFLLKNRTIYSRTWQKAQLSAA